MRFKEACQGLGVNAEAGRVAPPVEGHQIMFPYIIALLCLCMMRTHTASVSNVVVYTHLGRMSCTPPLVKPQKKITPLADD